MKKRGLDIHLKNRLSYTLIAIFILFLAAVFVYAVAPGVVPDPGHNVSQISIPSPCIQGQFLKYDGTTWVCSNLT